MCVSAVCYPNACCQFHFITMIVWVSTAVWYHCRKITTNEPHKLIKWQCLSSATFVLCCFVLRAQIILINKIIRNSLDDEHEEEHTQTHTAMSRIDVSNSCNSLVHRNIFGTFITRLYNIKCFDNNIFDWDVAKRKYCIERIRQKWINFCSSVFVSHFHIMNHYPSNRACIRMKQW